MKTYKNLSSEEQLEIALLFEELADSLSMLPEAQRLREIYKTTNNADALRFIKDKWQEKIVETPKIETEQRNFTKKLSREELEETLQEISNAMEECDRALAKYTQGQNLSWYERFLQAFEKTTEVAQNPDLYERLVVRPHAWEEGSYATSFSIPHVKLHNKHNPIFDN